MTRKAPVTNSLSIRVGAKQKATKPEQKRSPAKLSLREFVFLGGKLPLAMGESESGYQSFVRSIVKSVQPKSAIQQVIAKDLADAIYHHERLKRMPGFFLDKQWWDHARPAIEKVMMPDTTENRHVLADRFIREKAVEINGLNEVKYKLHKAGVRPEWIQAEASWASLDFLQAFEALIQAAEKRRDRLIRQISELQGLQHPQSRRTPKPDVIDLEAEDVTPNDD